MNERIKNRLKEFRTSAKMTQEDLARRVGVSRQSIIAIERGRYIPSLPLALKLSRLFGVRVEALFQFIKED